MSPLLHGRRRVLIPGTGTGAGCIPGGYTGWVLPWAPGTQSHHSLRSGPLRWTGYLLEQSPCLGPGTRKAEAWYREGPTGYRPGPGGVVPGCSAHPGPYPSNPASWPIRARLRVLLAKLSQNRIVSPKSVDKAYHSPYFQNGLGMSPLGFLRFPFSLAFSHKELSGHFEA